MPPTDHFKWASREGYERTDVRRLEELCQLIAENPGSCTNGLTHKGHAAIPMPALGGIGLRRRLPDSPAVPLEEIDKPTRWFLNFDMPPLRKNRPRGRTPNAERTDRSRRAVLEAAVPIFAERGYAASLNEIIRASGLTKGGFYFHFRSKAALALAVIDDYQRRWAGQVMAEATRHVRAVDRLFSVPRTLGRLARQGEGPAGLRRLIDDLARDPRLHDEVCGSLRAWIRQTAEQFREAQREGAIRRDVNADLLAEVAVGGFIGMQTMTEQLGDDDLERRIEALIEVIGRVALARPKKVRRSK